MQLTVEQVEFLLAVLTNTQLGGGLIDIAYQTKQSLIAARNELAESQKQ